MNGAQLEATFDAHKVPILATVGAGVAVLAFMRRKSAASSTPSSDASSGGQLASTASGGGASYDSTATDLAGYLGGLQSQLSGIQNSLDNPIPVPAPTPPVTPAKPTPPTPGPKPAPHQPTPPKQFQHPGPTPPHHGTDTWVTVLKGQTLSGIAAKYGASITPKTIAATNGIANPDRIYAGQRLHIVG